jgi:AbrB family looped-hinge helix DNA binding protein
MKTTIDSAGRLVIPKEIRREAGLRPGMALDVRWHDGHVEIEPAAAVVRLVRKGRFVVAAPQNTTMTLTASEVESTRDTLALAHERGS